MNPGTPLEEALRLDAPHKKALAKLGLRTVRDLLYHLPARYSDLSTVKLVKDLVPGDRAIVYGKIKRVKTGKAFRKKMPLGQATLEDATGEIKITWFNQPYLAKMFAEGAYVKVSGKVTVGKRGLYLANPEIEHSNELPIDSHDTLFKKGNGDGGNTAFYPVYPESRGVTSRFFHHAIRKLFAAGILNRIEETIPEEILKKYKLPGLRTALLWIHMPKKETQAAAARKRFAFEEVFFIQLGEQKERKEYEKHSSFAVEADEGALSRFLARFPFAPTGAQARATEAIKNDFKSGKPMLRLLEGDVGSGKTLVAAAAAHMIAMSRPLKRPERAFGRPSSENDGVAERQNFGNLQVAYMAPTEILAAQHFESFMEYFKGTGLQMGLITGSGCEKFPSKVNPSGATNISRTQLLKWVANGEIPILIGTHALIQKSVTFKHLGLVIIDEQHRFGTAQRGLLTQKGNSETPVPHLLSMTATPIPRTLALTIYGSLDLTLIDEMPKGRKIIITEIVVPGRREAVYEKISEALDQGRQAYVICPRIDLPDPEKELALQAKSVKAEAKRLKEKIFPGHEIAVLHSKMKESDKDEAMRRFQAGETDILVATSMVEVGVNVPNATVIVIEGAERFGLAQLHQLRGRVLRSTHQAYCFLFSETMNGKSAARLRALERAKNGFELAELDLLQRGAGELGGAKQWGLSDIGMEAIKNLKMVEAARAEAAELLKRDPALRTYPHLKLISSKRAPLHLE
ncbi:MAG: ATP-dependent DNA helicase RecG [bacterium]|nr:ATP-dependent DNA helicase RecG [bacterium]